MKIRTKIRKPIAFTLTNIHLSLLILNILLVGVSSLILYGAVQHNLFTKTDICDLKSDIVSPILHLPVDDTKTTKKFLVEQLRIDPKLGKEIADAIHAHTKPSEEFPSIKDVLAIMYIESAFKPDAVSSANAIGIMQVMRSTHDIYTNVYDGVSVLRDYYKILKDKEAAIQAYNIGIGSYLSGNRAEIYLSKYKTAYASISKRL